MIEYLLSVSLLIIAVLIIRAVFRKTVSPRVIYALWLVVIIRMAIPVTLFEIGITVPEFLKDEPQQALQTENGREDQPNNSTVQNNGSQMIDPLERPNGDPQNKVPVTPTVPHTSTTPTTSVTPTTPTAPTVTVTESEKTFLTPNQIINLVWIIGAVIIAAGVIITAVSYNRRLFKNRVFYKNMHGTRVYISKSADVPCIAGFIPSIYITPEAAKSESERLIIMHEYFHLRHGDHIWSALRVLALIVFWWNPLVWSAAILSKRDAELACDDSVSSRLDDKDRFKYANILIDTIPQKRIYAVGLGSAPMKERIIMLAVKKKNKLLCLVLAIVLSLSAVGCSFGSLNEKETDTEQTKAENTGKDTPFDKTSEDTTDISEETTDDITEETTNETKEPIDAEKTILYDYAKGNANNSLVYEGYTVEYIVNSEEDEVFDFHIHLPQISDKSPASEKWNTDIVKKYGDEYGEYLKKSEQGTNDRFFADVTWNTVTTGDIITVYIINHRGILYTGGQGIAYDIYHYDTANKKFLTTNEFLAYYAEGEFAGYTLSDILEVMNKTLYTAGDDGDIVPLTEKDIQGVIPSVLGDGRFDVVYQGYHIETKFADRILFDDYFVYTSKDTNTDVLKAYTYHYSYNDIKNNDVCQCKTGDKLAGYYLYMCSYDGEVGNNTSGYYVEDLILTEYIDFDIESSDDGNVYLHSDKAGALQMIPFENNNQ